MQCRLVIVAHLPDIFLIDHLKLVEREQPVQNFDKQVNSVQRPPNNTRSCSALLVPSAVLFSLLEGPDYESGATRSLSPVVCQFQRLADDSHLKRRLCASQHRRNCALNRPASHTTHEATLRAGIVGHSNGVMRCPNTHSSTCVDAA